jgi:signal transduction histidine kinase
LLGESRVLGEQVLRELRTMSYLLHPPLLEQRGLVETLRWYTDGFAKRSGIETEFVVADDLGQVPPTVEATLFRVVQESLTNIHRHSGSARATISLHGDGQDLVLRVEDYGAGIAATAGDGEVNAIDSLGVGIPGMRERLHQLGGRLEICREAGGTAVVARVPIDDLDVVR